MKKTVISLTLILATTLFTMGAKWEETYINRLPSIAGTWSGTGKDPSGVRYTITYWFKEDGSFKYRKTQKKTKQDSEQGSGALRRESGKLYYKSSEGLWTFTLYEGKKDALMLRVERPNGNTQDLIPAQ
ncbi:MAG: hypothetical protein R3268_12175 [Acidiferrobacterales bacterium]|nr:hypothetical protein [Acidiferrobacterales bacterium]